jgi:hypothetical protein
VSGLRLKKLVDLKVGRVKQQDAVRGLAVASGAADLLNVLLKRAGSVVVQDVADGWLPGATAESAKRTAQQENVETARRWLQRAEAACGGSKAAAAWARDSDLVPTGVQDWARWGSERLTKAGCPEDSRKAWLRELREEIKPVPSPLLTPRFTPEFQMWMALPPQGPAFGR